MVRDRRYPEWLSAPLLVFILALLLRLMLIAAKPDLDLSPALDSQRYSVIAGNLVAGNGFALDDGSPALNRGPLYPAFIAAVYWISGHNDLVVKIIQAVLSALIPLILYRIMLLLYAPGIALLGALLAALDIQLIAITAFRYPEILYTLLQLIVILLVMLSARKRSIPGMVLSGIVIALAVLTRPQLLVIPAVILVAFVLWRISWKQTLLWLAVTTVTMCLIIAPWTIRNYNVSGRFIPVALGLGFPMWVGNYLPLDGTDRHVISREIAARLTPGMSFAERDVSLQRIAVRGIIDEPLPHAWLMFRKVGRFWFDVYASSPKGTEAPRDNIIVIPFVIINTLLVVFAFAGLILSRSKLRGLSLILGVMLLTMLLAVITIPVARYRMPVMPFVDMFAAVGLYGLWLKRSRQSKVFMSEMVVPDIFDPAAHKP